ncbi:hypothetical protein FQZ97_989960 [compost metagenome]
MQGKGDALRVGRLGKFLLAEHGDHGEYFEVLRAAREGEFQGIRVSAVQGDGHIEFLACRDGVRRHEGEPGVGIRSRHGGRSDCGCAVAPDLFVRLACGGIVGRGGGCSVFRAFP